MSEPNVIRDMYPIEIHFDYEQQRGKLMNPRMFLLSTKLDLFSQRQKILKSIWVWAKKHPLLQAAIAQIQTSTTVTKHCFVYAPEEQLQALENVKFLHYSNKENKECWKYMIENELVSPFKPGCGLLWRIFVIELPKEGDTFKYCWLFHIHHSITDGKNAFVITEELFEIIEQMYDNIFDLNNNAIIYQHEINHPKDPRDLVPLTDDIKSALSLYNPIDDIGVNSFDFLKGNSEEKGINADGGVFLTADGDVFLTCDEINVKKRQQLGRLKFNEIDKEDFKKLRAIAKKMNAKITGVVETIAALAWRNTCRHFSGDSALNFNVKYQVSINLRSHLEPAVSFHAMGIFITSFYSGINFENSADFWEIAREKTEKLHQYLNEKPFLNDVFRAKERRFYELLKGSLEKSKKDGYIFFNVTNIGDMSRKKGSEERLINIDEYYSSESYKESDLFSFFFNSISSIDDRLFWLISFNSKYLSEHVMDYFSEETSRIIKSLILRQKS